MSKKRKINVKEHKRKGYVRKDGTYVKPTKVSEHYRENPKPKLDKKTKEKITKGIPKSLLSKEKLVNMEKMRDYSDHIEKGSKAFWIKEDIVRKDNKKEWDLIKFSYGNKNYMGELKRYNGDVFRIHIVRERESKKDKESKKGFRERLKNIF